MRPKNWKSDQHLALTAWFCFLGVWSIHKYLGSCFLGRNWKFMWKSYTGNIFDFMVKKILLLIFKTSFSENWPFLLLLSKILILSKLINGKDKRCSKYVNSIYFEHVLSIPLINLDKIRIFEKSSKNGQFLLNEVLKIMNINFLSIKSKMLTV